MLLLDKNTKLGGRDFAYVSSFGRIAKRSFDIVFSLAALLTTAILLAMIAIAIKLADGGPVIYRQTRVGKDGRYFGCLKFRTMVVDAEMRLAEHLAADPAARHEWCECRKLRKDPRIIPGIGSLLRKYSLDELPQFLNVLTGDMSVVGPRPVTPEELPLYGDKLKYYLAVKPGITGPWQISGRSNLNFDERVSLDAGYVRHWSFARDLLIVLRTVSVVIGGKDAY